MTEVDSEPMPEVELKEVERRIILTNLYNAMEWLHKKGMKGRIHKSDIPIVKARIDVFKALGYIAGIYNSMIRDLELDELKEEIEELKEMIQDDNKRD